MKFTEEQLSLIEDYIMNNLSQERKILFDENMKSEDFRNEVMKELSIVSAIQESANNTLKDTIRSFGNDAGESQDKNVPADNIEDGSTANYWKYIIGGLLVLALCFLLFWMSKGQNTANQVFADMYEPYPAMEVTRGQIDTDNISLTKAMDLYRQGEYQEALTSLKALNLGDASLDLYKGICYLELGRYSDAESTFSALTKSDKIETKQVAEWYNVLLFLKTENQSEFDIAIERILDNDSHFFHTKAKELKKKM